LTHNHTHFDTQTHNLLNKHTRTHFDTHN